jgi:hypothetical protein
MKWSHHFGVLKSEKSPLFGEIMLDRAKICLKCGYIEFYLDSENVKKLQEGELKSD